VSHANFKLDLESVTTVAVNLAAGSGDNTVIAASPGRRWIVFYAALATGGTASTITWKETGATLSGIIPIPADTIWEIEFGGEPLIQASAVNKALIIGCGAGDLDGWLQVAYTS